MILDGRAIAEEIYTELLASGRLNGKKIGIVVAGANPVVEQFVRIKHRAAERLGVEVVRVDVADNSDTTAITDSVRELALRTDAVIVQLPLPAGRQGFPGIDTNVVLSSIPKEKDVDAINPTIEEGQRPVVAPVALAVVELLERGGVSIAGKRAVVIGAGRLVGAPSAALLKRLGARVSMFTIEEGSIDDLKDADIIVCGAGTPGFVKPQHIKAGVALIDAGANEMSGKVIGDADPACAEKASVFTPVPGGVGPVAVAMIFKNLSDLVEKARS